ncbi:PKD domain-containing protein [Candidatus Bipolaricaulota bacterium]
MIIKLDRFNRLTVSIVFVAILALLLGGCVYTLGDQPSAVLRADKSSGAAPLSVIFDISDSFDPDGTITSYELQFGDGTSIAGENLATPKPHTYVDDGYYTAVLAVTDDDGYTGHAKLHVTVSNPGPTVGFICSPQVAQPGESVTCSACGQSTDPASLRAEPQSLITYEWNFGDGQQAFSQGCSITHVYEDVGTFDVSLTIYDNDGAVAEETAPDHVTVQGRLYWTEFRAIPSYAVVTVSRIHRAGLNGAGREELVSDDDSMKWGIALDLAAGKMYWTDTEAGTIERADLDGTNIESLIDSLSGPIRIALDPVAGKMYWTDWTDDTIRRADLDGTNIESLIDSLGDPFGIALDLVAGKMYWTDWTNGTIQRANLDGTNAEVLISGLDLTVGIALDVAAGKMYWTGGGVSSPGIQRANLDGSSVENLIDMTVGTSFPICIALDIGAGKMYWTNWILSETIQRANMNGTDVEDVVLWTSHALDIALEL